MFHLPCSAPLFALIVVCATASCASSQALAPAPETLASPPAARPSASTERPAPTGALRAGIAIESVRASGVIGACWQALIERNSTRRPERATVRVDFDADGRVREVTVEQACDPELRACIVQRVSTVRIEPGQPINVQANFNLAIEGDPRAPQPCLDRATTGDALAPDAAVGTRG